MTREAAFKFIEQYKSRNPQSFVKPSHLDELSPLLEVQIEAVEVRKDEFHNLAGSYSPKKETLDKFASAAGISFNTLNESTRKEGSAYVGTTQAMVMGPDGKMQFGAPCEYEFDPEVRLEELRLAGKTEWVNREKTTREYSERELAQEKVQLQKVGRQRANTGARNRATLMMLGMQTGFKGLFSKDDPDTATKVFLFSRIIVNAKNEMVAKVMLGNLAGNAMALFGGANPMGQISAPTERSADPVVVTLPSSSTPPQYEVVDDELPPDPIVVKKAALQDLIDKYRAQIHPDGLKYAEGLVSSNCKQDELDACLTGIKGVLTKRGVKFGDQ